MSYLNKNKTPNKTKLDKEDTTIKKVVDNFFNPIRIAITEKKRISFTYSLRPEKKGYSVKCLGWDSVFTQGATINECKKNAREVTEIYIKHIVNCELHQDDFPKIKKSSLKPNRFSLTFNMQSNTLTNK